MIRNKTIRIGLADSQSIFMEGLKILLQSHSETFNVVFQVTSGNKLANIISEDPIDILIMDLCLEDKDGVDLIAELKSIKPDLGVLIFTQYAQTKFIKNAFLDGADGYMLKNDKLDNLEQAIHSISEGKTFMGEGISIGPKHSAVSPHNSDRWKTEDPFLLKHELTFREREILSEICEGKTNKEIAGDLYISDQTVSVHKKNIMRKFNVGNTKQLKEIAHEFKLHEYNTPS